MRRIFPVNSVSRRSGLLASAIGFSIMALGCTPAPVADGAGTGGAGPMGGSGAADGGPSGSGGLPGATGGSSAGAGSGGSGAVSGSGGGAASAGTTGGTSASGGSSAGGTSAATGGLSGGGGRGGEVGTSPDAGQLDGIGSGGATGGGACAGLFCEDFEKGTIDPAIWDVKFNGGQAAPDLVTQAPLVAHGKYAAHFHVNPNVKSYDFIITKNPPAALRGHHFGRASFMVTPMPTVNHIQYIYSGTTGFPEYRYLEVASAGNYAWQLTYVDLVPPTTGEDYHAGGKVPLGKWFCLEWEFNDVPDQASVYVDGKLDYTTTAFTFGGATSGLVGGFAAFGFGYYIWHPVAYAFDIYYDDLVLDTKRVGCP